jgi:hypothetical protein
MEQLFREGMLRLSGKSDQAVFELTQAMGGGKTHMMVALGLLARHSDLRPEVLNPELNSRVAFGNARSAAFNERNNPENHVWGEIAKQLGAEEAIKPYWVNGPKAVDQQKWRQIIGDEPTLILFDELPPYLDNASTQVFGQGTLANMVVYSLSALMSAALELPNCCIVIANLSGSYQAQTTPDSICGFLHGKAGVIELANGRKLGFIGSMNDTRNAWQRNYEILWEDESAEGGAWIEQELQFLWNAARPLPEAVIHEVHRRGYRREVLVEEIDDDEDLAPAALAVWLDHPG